MSEAKDALDKANEAGKKFSRETMGSDGEILRRLGDDAAKWGAEFRQTAIRLGYSDMDEGWLISWFANAIEHSTDVRSARNIGER